MTLPPGKYSSEELELFKRIFDTYYEGVRNFIYYKTADIHLAEDLVQEIFLKVWDIRSKIEEETVKSLLFIMANNLVKNHFKHKKVVYNFENATMQDTDSESADFEIETKEFQAELQEVLSSVPENSRIVFLMNRIDNFTYTEIAQRLGLSVKTVEKRMHEALRVIKEKIKYKI